ncbi:MAG TPA: S8/S53 family peptidase [Micromonosporaceae bacterium]|nr:S8/S53 family peptidase [Micromonosporaceae bacterium]
MPINPIDPSEFRRGVPGDEEQEQHRRRVRQQVRELAAASAPSAEEILNRIREVQDLVEGEGGRAMPFDTYRPEGRDEGEAATLVARDQLVVRLENPRGVRPAGQDEGAAAGQERGYGGPGRQEIIEILRDMDYDIEERIGARDSRNEVFRYSGRREPAELASDIRMLRDRGVTANMHVVVPLGHIIKGGDLPAKTPYTVERRSGGTYPPGPRVRVAVIDTGVGPVRTADQFLTDVEREPDNAELLDVAPVNQRLDWFSGHGTFTAGIVQQVAPDVEVVVYRFISNNGLGTEKDVAEELIRAADDAAAESTEDAPIRLVINASVGAPPAVDGTPPIALRDAVELIQERYPEVLIVASSGNDGTTLPMYPAAFKQVVAVGALTDDMQGADFSNRGHWVDCSAVGVGLVSTFVEGTLPPEPQFDGRYDVTTFPPDPFAVWTGTSFSAPQICGAVAQLCRQNPDLSPRAALNTLLAGQPELPGFGRVVRILPGTPL